MKITKIGAVVLNTDSSGRKPGMKYDPNEGVNVMIGIDAKTGEVAEADGAFIGVTKTKPCGSEAFIEVYSDGMFEGDVGVGYNVGSNSDVNRKTSESDSFEIKEDCREGCSNGGFIEWTMIPFLFSVIAFFKSKSSYVRLLPARKAFHLMIYLCLVCCNADSIEVCDIL